MRLLAATLIAALTAASALGAWAQQPDPIRVLDLSASTVTSGFTKAVMPLTVAYSGSIAAGEHVYVRVFRGSPAELKGKYARALRVGQCVLFTSSARYEAYSNGDGVFRINDVVDFFRTNTGQDTQVLTLVFEEGGNSAPDGPLKLSLKGLNTYFDNALTMNMTAPTQMQDEWRTLVAQQRQEQQRAQVAQSGHSSGGFWSWLGVKPVEAKENPASQSYGLTPAGASLPPVHVNGAVVAGPCQKVTAIPLTVTKPGASKAEAGLPPLRAFAELAPAACGL
jgi:hypothetical protein